MKAKLTQPTPVEQLESGMAFYAALGLEVWHFGPTWRLFKLGQMLQTELDHICARHEVSTADFHLLCALMMEPGKALRSTDIARRLNTSMAVLSGRLRRLAEARLIIRLEQGDDRRAIRCKLTKDGADKVTAVATDIERQSRMVHHLRNMPQEDTKALNRLLGGLHEAMDRDFPLPARQGA